MLEKEERVAVIERNISADHVQTSRVCPAENIIHSAKVASYFRRSKKFGIAHSGFTIYMLGVRERKRAMVHGMNEMCLENYQKTGAEFILGTGRFLAPRTVEVALADWEYASTARRKRDRQYRNAGHT